MGGCSNGFIFGAKPGAIGAGSDPGLGNSTTKFDPGSNILTLPDIYRFAEQKSVGQVSKAVQRLEEELSSRALQLLQRFNASADRVLQVITAHEVSPAAVIQLLGLDSSTEVDAIYSAHSLQPLLKPIAYEAIAVALCAPTNHENVKLLGWYVEPMKLLDGLCDLSQAARRRNLNADVTIQ